MRWVAGRPCAKELPMSTAVAQVTAAAGLCVCQSVKVQLIIKNAPSTAPLPGTADCPRVVAALVLGHYSSLMGPHK